MDKVFSRRTGWDRDETPLARAVRLRRARGLPVTDLTVANPTQCGLALDPEALLTPWREPDPALFTYDPQPFGRVAAREAVCGYYGRHAAPVDPGQVCLTAGTSEGYSFLFRLLCNPGDEVLIASPSYPLFDYLATLDDIRLVSYPLLYDHGWSIEPGAIEARVTPRTRAIALVHPNNPTGHFLDARERAELETLCSRHSMALIVDEVFLDYPWHGFLEDFESGPFSALPRSFAQGPHPALTFVLSGLSKVAALPQMKLSWIATFGPQSEREEALARLEVIADAYLSVSAPAQVALGHWLRAAGDVQQRIRARVARNLRLLDQSLVGTAMARLQAEGGWYAVLRVPALEPDEALALRLVEQVGLLVHPGSSFGFPPGGRLVISLLLPSQEFAAACVTLVQAIGSPGSA